MNQFFEIVGVSASGKESEKVKLREGIRVETIEMTRKITPIQDLVALWRLYRFFKKEKPQIVHSHTPKAGLLGMMAAKLAGIPIRMHTVAGMPLMEATGIKRKILNFVERLTYRSATHVYPNSKGLYEFILNENFTSKSKLKIIGQGSSNGIDTTYFSPDEVSEETKSELRNKWGIEKNDFVFVFVGRMVKDKGINELVKAFSQLKTQNSKLILVGPFEQELDPLSSETIQEINENSAIISVGFQADVRPYFAISDALVFPSYREGFPNVVMQAGAMGLPSIVSDINGCNEIIVENENGLIIPTKDERALSIAMLKLVQETDLRNRFALNARKMILDRYEQNRVWEKLLEEYRNLLG
ncbi:glycosyltransferase family 4 protein [Moheibacter sp. BDHS18]|uniref:Glycosyltransferase family 4 protein n=2 Tax=Moheibacter lacus TaxID=2745851 RepID=A0A838ZPT3_9FLAO|nr:glycosyltransferase family 4 protein [Moheibacter lacus]